MGRLGAPLHRGCGGQDSNGHRLGTCAARVRWGIVCAGDRSVFCPQCGVNAADDARFCRSCGATLNQPSPTAVPASTTSSGTPPPSTPSYSPPSPPPSSPAPPPTPVPPETEATMRGG